MAAKSHPHKAAAAATLNILQGTDVEDPGPESKAKDLGVSEALKTQPPLDPAKKKLKLKPADPKAFAAFKRDVVNRLTRIEQLLEQQAIMLRYPAPIYPHMVPPPPNGVAPPPPPFSQAPPPRTQAFSPIPAPPLPTAPYPNLPYFPPASAPPPQVQPPSQPSVPAVSGGVEEGDHKKRRLFAGMDLRDHRKVSNKRGGRGTRKTCRKCAAEGIENVLLVGHKCPYGQAKVAGSSVKGGADGVAGVKRASDGTALVKLETVRLRTLPAAVPPVQSVLQAVPPVQNVLQAVPPVHNVLQAADNLLTSLQTAPQSVGPHQMLLAPPSLQQVLPSSQAVTSGGKVGG